MLSALGFFVFTGAVGLEPTTLRFWRPLFYQLNYTPKYDINTIITGSAVLTVLE